MNAPAGITSSGITANDGAAAIGSSASGEQDRDGQVDALERRAAGPATP